MKTSIRMVLCLSLLTLLLPACSEGPEDLAKHCKEMERAVVNERDCDRLALALEALSEPHLEWMKRLNEMSAPGEDEAQAWGNALEPCLRARLEASAGSCRHHEGVTTSLKKMHGE